MKKISIWIDNIKDKELPKLKENITCDILIIGGGIAGLSTAYNLKVAKLYLDSQKEAIDIITNIIKENKIECNLEKTNAYVFSNNENNYKNFDKEIKFYDKNNIKYKVLSSLPINYQ